MVVAKFLHWDRCQHMRYLGYTFWLDVCFLYTDSDRGTAWLEKRKITSAAPKG
jgi:hypothetical protein